MKPQYFQGSDGYMLYAAYPDISFFEISGRWQESTLTLSTFTEMTDFWPCSLADVRAHHNNIKAHKRDS